MISLTKQRMLIWISLIFIASYSLVGCAKSVSPQEIAGELAKLDNYDHSPEQFLSIMRDVHNNNREYSIQKVGDGIARTWNGVKVIEKDISIYTVANDIKQLSEEEPQAGFAEIMAAYMMKKILKKKE